jgi:tetratricopeptide (TPR) repeat protein
VITLSFYSYKGGVGRSLTLANLGVYLAQFGATVVMIDFDLEAPGLHYKIRPNDPLEPPNRGVAGLLADVSLGVPTESLDFDLAMDVSAHAGPVASDEIDEADSPSGRLYLIPAGNPMGSGYWSDLAAIDWDRLFIANGRRGVSALSQLKAHIEETLVPDVLLVDSRTGITPGGGVATTLLPDVVVTMMLNTPEHLDGSSLVVSAVSATEREDSDGPKVVPVLSRYTSAQPEERTARSGVAVRAREHLRFVQPSQSGAVDAPLAELSARLIRDLTPSAAERVLDPLVLHSDPSLQEQEYLTFGPYARARLGQLGQTLLEDYLRLFAGLVPNDLFLRYLTGVREHVRGILLDRPDDAVRTLESLATLVGDEDAFIDLVKLYLLRRDTRKLLQAAESLFRVHDRVVPHPALSKELRNLVAGRARSRLSAEGFVVAPEFAEKYWREVAGDDVEWGSSIARLYADREQMAQGRKLADELIARDPNPKTIAEVVRVISFGGDQAEGLAIKLAMEYFDLASESEAFLNAAAIASRFQKDAELAKRVLDTPASNALDSELLVEVLSIAGRFGDAASLFLDAYATASDDDVHVEALRNVWVDLVKRVPRLRVEFGERNPELLALLEREHDF